ncbi:MAG: ion transporter [Agathobacter sp.]|nr:ion transporter [Agathobacter sp.]
MRKRLFEIIEKANEGDKISKVYDSFMILSIIVSIIPLCFSKQNSILYAIDKITAAIFIMDYILRFFTADFTSNKKGFWAFAIYPFKPMAIVDLLSILPSVTNLSHAFKVFRVLRLLKALRVFKFFRYSKNIKIITNVLVKKKDALLTVGMLALSYIFVTALIIFQVEPSTFDNFFQAIYWATVSLTTVGYGDIYPTSAIGQVISMISSFLGIAIVALPSGIIISGYQDEVEQNNELD